MPFYFVAAAALIATPTNFWYKINHARSTQVSASVEESIQESTSGSQTPVVGKGAHECDTTLSQTPHLQGWS